MLLQSLIRAYRVEILIKSLETRQQRYDLLVFATGLTGLVADAGKLRRLSCSQDDFIWLRERMCEVTLVLFLILLSFILKILVSF